MAGDVKVKPPGPKGAYGAAAAGAKIANGSRVKTEATATAKLTYPDGSVVDVKSGSELIVRVVTGRPSGVTLFAGRVWSKVAKGAGGDTKFEVESANAVAGVRGTEFEVGVGIDGSTRVRVTEGEVAVGGEDDRPVPVSAGKEIESEDGRMGKARPAPEDPDWDGWFTRSAQRMEKTGLKVAKSLDGRLNRRKAQVQRLLAQIKTLKQAVIKLEAQKKRGEDVGTELEKKFSELEKVTARMEGMKERLEGAFGVFDRWKSGVPGPDADKIAGMSKAIEKVAADFADMVEEGTDQSQESMDEMMDDGRRGKSDKPKDSAADELFK